MIDEDPDLDPRYRAPRAFGPMPGPRNIPLSQRDAGWPDEVTTSLAVSLEADPAQLMRLMPPGLRLLRGIHEADEPAMLTVTATRFENLVWLAGRGYPILTVTFPVEYIGADGDQGEPLQARYLPVLWEGLPDPVTTGREELAFPKLFANIQAPGLDEVSATGSAVADASWDGFQFVDLSAEDLRDVPIPEPEVPLGTLVHRYVPNLADRSQADIDELVYHSRSPVPGSTVKRPVVTDLRIGTGRFSFRPTRFEDSPVQYTVINTLAALSLSATGPATLSRSTAAPGNVPGATPPRILRAAWQPAVTS